MMQNNIKVLASALGLLCAPFCFGQAVEADNAQIDFGLLNEGQSNTIQVELSNLLDEEVTIESLDFYDFYGTNPFTAANVPTSIPANGSVVFDVIYAPLHNMNHNSELQIKTSGNRGAIAIDLHGDCQYTNTYYDETYNLLDEDLEDAFEDILGEGYDEHSYSGARDEMFMEIDNQRVNGQGASENTINRAYLGTDAVGYTSRSNAQSAYNLNTEHTWPQGTFNQNLPMRTDLHHLFVTDVDANSTRGSYAFGIVDNATWSEGGSQLGTNTSGTTVFEPRDAHKGKTSRGVLYFILRYQNYSGFLTANQEEVLREWNRDYTPTDAEVTRNDDIHVYQNNRNPLTDYPQFSDRIYSYRLDQDRPNTGVLSPSHDAIYFELVAISESATFNLVLTNTGERFINITNLEIVDNSSNVYSLDGSLPSTNTINPGESLNIPVEALVQSSNDDLEATLNFNTNVAGSQDMSLPISSTTVVGIFDQAVKQEIVLVPNPFSTELRIVNGTADIETVRIFDITGRLVVQLHNPSVTIDMSSLPGGMYQAILQKRDGSQLTQKLVKQ